MNRLRLGADALDDRSLVSVARLCSGRAPLALSDWARVLGVAISERCAPLAWLRGAEMIRLGAPLQIAQKWHSHARCNADAALGQAAELDHVLSRLLEAGIEAAVIKGLPMSVMLYGDVSARPSTDFDLVVKECDRESAHESLTRLGWNHKSGRAPWESMYVSARAAYCRSLEIHSSLTDDNLLAHITLTADDVCAVQCGGATVPAVSGAELALFLSVHLAKHGEVPLLWWIDFATVCALASDESLLAVHALAGRAGLEGFLNWALDGAGLLREVIEGADRDAVESMTRLRAFHADHNALRVARLSSNRVDAGRVLLAWAWPRPMRRHAGAYFADAMRRARLAAGALRHNAAAFRGAVRHTQ